MDPGVDDSGITEALVGTLAADGTTHLAPLGFRRQREHVVLAPFHPSRTLDNLRERGVASISHVCDVRVFAGCLTGRRDWPLLCCERVACARLADAVTHQELRVLRIDESDPQRPRFVCRELLLRTHGPWPGYNRAQAAVLEACILVSRLQLLPVERIRAGMEQLAVAVDKTAGTREREAWQWLLQRVQEFDAARAHVESAR
jgi:hypothetical protein